MKVKIEMIDLDLNAADQAIIQLVHDQALIYRRYARAFDADQFTGFAAVEVPEENNFIHVRNAMLAQESETSGAEIMDMLITLEEIWGDKPVRYRGHGADTMNFFLSNSLLKQIGSAEQYAKWKESYLCYALTEPGAGSDPSQIRTTARYDSATNEWVLNGEKLYISLGQSSEAALVLARFIGPDGERGISTFVVEKGTPGWKIGAQIKKMGIRSWDTTPMAFVDCRIPNFNHLKGDLKNTLAILNTTRPMVGAQGLGYARAALDFTRNKLLEAGYIFDYASGLRGQSAISNRLIRLEALYEAGWLTVVRAKWIEKVEGPKKLEAAMAKAKGGKVARQITQECLELLGPLALSEDYLIEKWFRDSRIVDIFEGPGEIQRLIIGRTLLNYTAAELN